MDAKLIVSPTKGTNLCCYAPKKKMIYLPKGFYVLDATATYNPFGEKLAVNERYTLWVKSFSTGKEKLLNPDETYHFLKALVRYINEAENNLPPTLNPPLYDTHVTEAHSHKEAVKGPAQIHEDCNGDDELADSQPIKPFLDKALHNALDVVGWYVWYHEWDQPTYVPKPKVKKAKKKAKTLHELFEDKPFVELKSVPQKLESVDITEWSPCSADLWCYDDVKRHTQTGTLITRPLSSLKTQKARGMAELSTLHLRNFPYYLKMPEWYVVQDTPHRSGMEVIHSKKDVLTGIGVSVTAKAKAPYCFLTADGGGVFARPCPTIPRHGFVDSRPVASKRELLEVWLETKQADVDGELILMPTIEASYSMVWGNGLLSIGPENDGATSGKNAVLFPTTDPAPIAPLNPQKGFVTAENPFIEFVKGKHPNELAERTYVVQLRDGPQMGRSPDWIPEDMVVSEVVSVDDHPDGLEWEAWCQDHANPEDGLVIDHYGGTPGSHYFIHAVLNSIPIVTTSEVHIGEELERRTDIRKPDTVDVKAFLVGVNTGLAIDIDRSDAVKIVLAVLHNSVYQPRDEALYAKFAGAAVGLCLRLGACAAIAESRYCNEPTEYTEKLRGRKRENIYGEYWQRYDLARRRLGKTVALFNGGAFDGGYGGKKWGTCTEAIVTLHNQVWELTEDPDSLTAEDELQQVDRIMGQLNTTINLAHNNGWWFNKFCSSAVFNDAAERPSVMAVEMGAYLYKIALDRELGKRSWAGAHIKAESIPGQRKWYDAEGKSFYTGPGASYPPSYWVTQAKYITTSNEDGEKVEGLHFQVSPMASMDFCDLPHDVPALVVGCKSYITYDLWGDQVSKELVAIVKAQTEKFIGNHSLAGTATVYHELDIWWPTGSMANVEYTPPYWDEYGKTNMFHAVEGQSYVTFKDFGWGTNLGIAYWEGDDVNEEE